MPVVEFDLHNFHLSDRLIEVGKHLLDSMESGTHTDRQLLDYLLTESRRLETLTTLKAIAMEEAGDD